MKKDYASSSSKSDYIIHTHTHTHTYIHTHIYIHIYIYLYIYIYIYIYIVNFINHLSDIFIIQFE